MSDKQRVTISGLKPNQSVQLRALLVGKELLSYAKGKQEHFRLKVEVVDRTGRITGNVWNNAEQYNDYLEEGSVVDIKAIATEWNNVLGLNIHTITLVGEAEDSPKNYLPSATVDLAQLYTEIKNWILSMEDQGLKSLLHYIYLDVENSPYPRKIVEAIGAVQQHHAYIGGLLEHTYHVTYWAREFAKRYKLGEQQRVLDLVTAGGLLHDIGKLDTYVYDRIFDRTVQGQLLEHIAIGSEILERILALDAASENPRFQLDADTKLRLKHMILSHHGKLEWGSPVLPQTPEAMILHMADMVDSQFNKLEHLIVRSGDAEWTERTNLIGNNVRIYLGNGHVKTKE